MPTGSKTQKKAAAPALTSDSPAKPEVKVAVVNLESENSGLELHMPTSLIPTQKQPQPVP